MYMAFRQIWQDDVFGSEDISTEDEIQCINDIFFSPSASKIICVFLLTFIVY